MPPNYLISILLATPQKLKSKKSSNVHADHLKSTLGQVVAVLEHGSKEGGIFGLSTGIIAILPNSIQHFVRGLVERA